MSRLSRSDFVAVHHEFDLGLIDRCQCWEGRKFAAAAALLQLLRKVEDYVGLRHSAMTSTGNWPPPGEKDASEMTNTRDAVDFRLQIRSDLKDGAFPLLPVSGRRRKRGLEM
jgi:hypothetical protein